MACDHNRTGSESAITLRAFLEREVPSFFDEVEPDEIVEAPWDFTDNLADLGVQAQEDVAKAIEDLQIPGSLGKRRALARHSVASMLVEMDKAVLGLLDL